MSDEQGYNGWTNYETWVTALWIDNSEPEYRTTRDKARAMLDPRFLDMPRTVYYADWLKGFVEETRPEVEGYWADMMGAAFSEVDWYEIAENYLAEFDGVEA